MGLDDRDCPIGYVDGFQFGSHHLLAALGVDDDGNKRILELWGGGENALVAPGLFEHGMDPGRARLFVLDGGCARP